MRIPVLQIAALCAGCAVILGLFLARGFNLHEQARIVFGAIAVCWLAGASWTLASAAETAGGWRRLGATGALLILVATLAAAFAPGLAVWAFTGH